MVLALFFAATKTEFDYSRRLAAITSAANR